MKLIMLPGMDGTGNLFNPLLAELDRLINTSVIVYPQEIGQSYESLTNWVLSEINNDEEFILLGESFSGAIAFDIAARKLPNLVGCIFVAAFLENPKPSLSWLAGVLPLDLLFRFKLHDFIVRKFLLGTNANTSLISEFWKSVKSVDPQVLQDRLSSIMALTNKNKSIETPCVYLGGTNDFLVPDKNIKAFNKRCINFSERLIPAPHFLLQAEPEVCARIIEEEIDRFLN